MFILRTLFWVGVVLLLLPVGRTETPHMTSDVTDNQAVTTGQALSAAYSTVNDLSSFCSRNPDTCEVGAAAFSAVEAKAKAGVRVLYDWATSAPAASGEPEGDRQPSHDASMAPSNVQDGSGRRASRRVAGAGTSRNTLRLEDIIPEWSGPKSNGRA